MSTARAGRGSAPVAALPDFRNLGVLARVLVAVNAAAFFAATVGTDDFDQFTQRVLDLALVVEPTLLAALALLWLLDPLLAQLPYRRALALIALLLMALGAGVRLALAGIDASAHGAVRGATYALLATLLLAAWFHLRQRAFSPALSEARLQALQARIRPHFLFNTLNAVLSLVRSDPPRAEAALEDLADLYRMVMTDSKRLVELSRELELAHQYLDLEQLRLGTRLNVEWHIEKAPQDALVPPLLLQPLVENAVYHGIEPGLGPGTIEVTVVRYRDRVQMRLRNPCHPEQQHRQGNRMALANIRERLALHFDAEATLESSVRGECFEIRISMPYRRRDNHAPEAQR